nr:MAG TPA: F/Y-rich N-terminus [Caudoviricetes sp.]
MPFVPIGYKSERVGTAKSAAARLFATMPL